MLILLVFLLLQKGPTRFPQAMGNFLSPFITLQSMVMSTLKSFGIFIGVHMGQ